MSFAHTKIQRPRPRAGLLLARPALERDLVSALSTNRVVLVCAPAGYGKTALLVRALDQLPGPPAVAWVSLDPGDDLHRLLECLVAALEPFDLPWRTAPEGLVAMAVQTGDRARREVVDELVNTLEACDVAHGVIVLDDLHHIADPACIAFLELWLQRLGARWTVAVAARREPALRLARLRAAGELADVQQAQLRFTRDEARALLAGAGLDAGTADALYERTGGWAAGLRLAFNGARGGNPGSAIDRQAFDYLATEVLAHVEPALREFLLRTSVLQDLDEQRCAALMGDHRASAWLDEIERLGLFASVTDDTVRTLHLHDLFRDALQHRLRLEHPQEWLPLHERAARVESDPLRRQALLLEAQLPDEAARALVVIAPQLVMQGGAPSLLRLVDAFPPGFVDSSAELQFVAGVAWRNMWEVQLAERHFARAEWLYGARGNVAAARTARSHRAVILTHLGRLTDTAAVLASLQDEPLLGEVRIAMLLATLWHALEGGALHAVARHFNALMDALEAQPVMESWFLTVPPPRQTACPGAAAPLARWATGALAIAHDRPVQLHMHALLMQAWHALWQGRVDDAASLLERAQGEAQWMGLQLIARSQALALSALLRMVRGARAAALEAMRTRVAEFPAGYGDWGLWHTLFFAARVAAACGDAATVREWLQRLAELQPRLPDAEPARLRPLLGLQGTLAGLEGRRDEAITRWRAAIEHEEQVDLLGQAAELRLRMALALLQAGALPEAASTLEPLLAQADDGPRGALFCVAALAELAATEWHGRLDAAALATLQRWAAVLRPAARTAPTSPAPVAHAGQRLTAREFEVLERIANGDSNKLIARALDLSPYTVKRHVAHILDKLELASRGQATAWLHAQAGRAAPRES